MEDPMQHQEISSLRSRNNGMQGSHEGEEGVRVVEGVGHGSSGGSYGY